MFLGAPPVLQPKPDSLVENHGIVVSAGFGAASILLIGGAIGALIAGKGSRTKGALIGAGVPIVLALLRK